MKVPTSPKTSVNVGYLNHCYEFMATIQQRYTRVLIKERKSDKDKTGTTATTSSKYFLNNNTKQSKKCISSNNYIKHIDNNSASNRA
ncbi:CLUMA_CG004264, isoform A [Clunio marinus]|uniref:CLUMA_CG004264, isoform A n=1 Tax=Clunio marinus TaxID=568069 RepID=A0A1J1HWQ9_9DIPT|nr:CLUMA_CG004264, isoform A [Clunio marinus]